MKTPVSFRPLDQFPGKRSSPRRSQFKSTYSQTMELLDRELSHLQATDVVISLDCDERELRRDGMPRADCRPKSPAVVISFHSRKSGHMQFPCATFTDWQDNIRAIAMSLEALRQVDRYGVTQNHEQYKGWSKLADHSKPQMTPEQAANVIARHSKSDPYWILNSSDKFRATLKSALVATHPDKHGGDETKFREVQAARDVLEKHFGGDE